jgi:predicted regulator of amino acid metabolism with ACT domain
MSSKSKVSINSKVVKKTTLIIQLDEDLKNSFQELCKAQDMNCSQTLRKFMKASVEVYKREKLNILRNK